MPPRRRRAPGVGRNFRIPELPHPLGEVERGGCLLCEFNETVEAVP